MAVRRAVDDPDVIQPTTSDGVADAPTDTDGVLTDAAENQPPADETPGRRRRRSILAVIILLLLLLLVRCELVELVQVVALHVHMAVNVPWVVHMWHEGTACKLPAVHDS